MYPWRWTRPNFVVGNFSSGCMRCWLNEPPQKHLPVSWIWLNITFTSYKASLFYISVRYPKRHDLTWRKIIITKKKSSRYNLGYMKLKWTACDWDCFKSSAFSQMNSNGSEKLWQSFFQFWQRHELKGIGFCTVVTVTAKYSNLNEIQFNLLILVRIQIETTKDSILPD